MPGKVTQPPHVLIMTRRFVARRDVVFGAISQAEHMQHWMCPAGFSVPSAQADAREGGRYRVEMLSPEGQRFVVGGRYLVIERPARLAFTWTWEPPHSMANVETIVTIQLIQQGDETILTMTHTGLPNETERAEHEQGWTGAYVSLEKVLKRLAR
jgi:glutathione S-transferase